MKTVILTAVILATLPACSGNRSGESENPPPATVKIDSAGVVVDTSQN
jgi:hypothetical protein